MVNFASLAINYNSAPVMRKLLFLFFAMPFAMLSPTSCRMAPSTNLGDTVEAKYFEPIDSTTRDTAHSKKQNLSVRDSLDIYVIGPASTAATVQLLSYPSCRDTVVYKKERRIKVTGNADYDHIVRAKFRVSKAGDTLVTHLEEIKDLPAIKDKSMEERGIKE